MPRSTTGAAAKRGIRHRRTRARPLQLSSNMMKGVKVFTATKAKDREALGDVVTRWLQENPNIKIIERTVTQSSDSQFHCLTITLIYETAGS
jgi:hypothetical protein